MARVLVDLCDGRGAIELAAAGPRAGGLRDLPYFVAIAQAAAERAPSVDRFVISYGPCAAGQLTARDVWLLVGDETSLPSPLAAPCPVFRTYGDRFVTPPRGAGDPQLVLTEVLLAARNRLRAARVMWPHPLARPVTDGWLPLGTPGIDRELTSVPTIAGRSVDVGFRGSLGGGRAASPRTVTRRRMRAGIERLPAGLVLDLLPTESFHDSYSRVSADYTDALLDTKICLAPRGGSLETYRTFEAALCGCVLVTEPLPDAWFYAGLPRAQVRSWTELPRVVASLLRHPLQMQQMSEGARRWATDVVSAPAIGRWVARTIAT